MSRAPAVFVESGIRHAGARVTHGERMVADSVGGEWLVDAMREVERRGGPVNPA